jgi:hypothetical protein
LAARILGFEADYRKNAKLFPWRFASADLDRILSAASARIGAAARPVTNLCQKPLSRARDSLAMIAVIHLETASRRAHARDRCRRQAPKERPEEDGGC